MHLACQPEVQDSRKEPKSVAGRLAIHGELKFYLQRAAAGRFLARQSLPLASVGLMSGVKEVQMPVHGAFAAPAFPPEASALYAVSSTWLLPPISCRHIFASCPFNSCSYRTVIASQERSVCNRSLGLDGYFTSNPSPSACEASFTLMRGLESQATASFAEIKPFLISVPLSSFETWQDSLPVDTKSLSDIYPARAAGVLQGATSKQTWLRYHGLLRGPKQPRDCLDSLSLHFTSLSLSLPGMKKSGLSPLSLCLSLSGEIL